MITTTTSAIRKDIKTALDKLGEDIEVQKHAKINPEAMQANLTKLFDHFHDSHSSLLRRVENIENQGKIILETFLGYLLDYLKACIEASSSAAQKLTEIVKKYPYFSISQVRADINLNQVVKIMILLKGNWVETEAPSEEALNQLQLLESDFFDLEAKDKYAAYKNEKPSQINIETHWLLQDSRLDEDSLNRDYPISVRY